ncbi:MAG TPA: Ig-like domain-containing protein [Ornithinibacter sp.]|nr:Ig-like domain-containing protein [Ornithinibacter sp.]
MSACIGITAAVALIVTTSGADPLPSAVRLHLGEDGRYFAYGSTVQPLTTHRNGCQITSAEPVIDLSSPTPSTAQPGLGADGLGVKGSNASGNGTPCSQIDGLETLVLGRGASLGSRLFTGVRLDLEMTGNGVVTLTFTPPTGGSTGGKPTTYTLQTGSQIDPLQTLEPGYDSDPNNLPYDVSSTPTDSLDACAAPNSSGPNSGGSDNCRWLVQPGFEFASVTIAAAVGTAALEGGGDFGGGEAFETLLYLNNSAPTANNDAVTTNEDTAVNGNVLANDTDAESDPLTATKLTNPSNGTVTFGSNGAFTYTPAADFNGTDSFTYRASDGVSNSGTATVNITVNAVNDPPVPATAGASTNEDQSVVVTVATDVDSSDGSATCTLTDAGGSPLGGTVVDGPGFTVTVTPPADFAGAMTLTCTVTDAEGATATTQTVITVGVTGVNDAPVAVDDVADVDENSVVDIDVAANDLDVEDDVLTPVEIAAVSPAGAAATVNPDGTVRYTPPSNYIGAGSFTYKANDGALTSANAATVSVTVYPVICTTETVGDVDDENGPEETSGYFTRLEDDQVCKRYTVDADKGAAGLGDETVTFDPSGGATVAYRGILTFPADAPPVGPYPLLLRYDPTGGNTFKPVQWCVNPQFTGGVVTSATLPGDQSPGNPDRETWCVAKAETTPDEDGNLVTRWQVYGEDDPRFTR